MPLLFWAVPVVGCSPPPPLDMMITLLTSKSEMFRRNMRYSCDEMNLLDACVVPKAISS